MAYTLSNSAPYANVVLGGTGGTTYSLSSGTTNAIWTSTGPYASTGVVTVTGSNGSSNGSLQVSGDAEFGGKVKINGQDLAQTLETIQRRLAILVPNPKLLDKYEALQQAYDHYKTLEALCIEENNAGSSG